MKKLACIMLALLLCGMTIGPALAEDDFSLQHLREMGALCVGTTAQFPQMTFIDETTGELSGFDIDLAKGVCEVLNVEFQYSVISWDEREEKLNSGDIACFWDSFSLTEDRASAFELTEPYLNNQLVWVAAAGKTAEDFAGKTIGVLSSSFAEEVIARDEHASVRSELGAIVGYESVSDMQAAISNGEIEAMLIDWVVAHSQLLMRENSGLEIVQRFADDYYVVAFRKGDIGLRDAVQDAIDELTENGTIKELSLKWFGEELAG